MKFIQKTLLVLSLGLSTISFSQDSKAMRDAFANSFIYESKVQYPEAIKEMLNMYSDKSYLINCRIGWLSYLNKEYANSIKYYKIACTLNPEASEPLWGLALPLLATEKWADLENTYLKITRYDPKNSLVNYRLGMIYYYRKNYVEAIKYFDITLTLYPLDYDAILMSAWTKYFLGKKDEAKVLFNRILLMYQQDASAIEGLTLCNK
jgi:tetratricopeptide (TPR) repeat protein